MSNILIKNIIRFIVLIIIQVFLLNKIQVSGYINPYIYILFILLLPIDIPKWQLLILSFLIGLCIDLFSGQLGVHAAATVFMGYLRPRVITLVGTMEDADPGLEPNLGNFGLLWFVAYASILVFMHHLVLFYIEVFRMSEFFSTLLRILISTLITLTLIIILEFLFGRRAVRKQ